MTQIAAVIFDLDGTLVDTEALAAEAGIRALAALGHEVGDDLMRRLAGIDEVTGHRMIEAHLGAPVDAVALDRGWGAALDAVIAERGMPLKPGVAALLDHLDARGVARAIASSSRRRRVLKTLDQAGIAGRFPVVITWDDVTRAKPDPEPYLRAAAGLGVAPAGCLVFEDSETGAEAAARAGMRVVQVPDRGAVTARWAGLVAPDLWSGARAAGLVLA